MFIHSAQAENPSNCNRLMEQTSSCRKLPDIGKMKLTDQFVFILALIYRLSDRITIT